MIIIRKLINGIFMKSFIIGNKIYIDLLMLWKKL